MATVRPMARCSFLLAAAFALAGARARGGANIDVRDVRVEYGEVDAYRATLVAESVRYAHGQLRGKLGLTIPKRVTVRLLRVKEAFVGMSGGRPVELYAGMAYPDSAEIHVNMNAVDRDPSSDAYTRTIRHELVHLAIAYSLGKPELPRWFEEGLACEFASLPRPRGELAGAIPLKSLERFPRNDKHALSRAYAQADSVMRFLASRRGISSAKAALHRVGAGESFDDALLAATGYTTDSLDAEWRAAVWPWWGWRAVRFVFAPSMVLLWAALIAIAGFFIVKRRRRREAEGLDSYV
jgi:hypothetical protein